MKIWGSTSDDAARFGSVLILVLWALFFLSSLALAVSVHVSAGMDAARRMDLLARARLLAVAGVERAIMEAAVQRTNTWDGVNREAWNRNAAVFKDVQLGPGSFSVYFVRQDEDGQSVTNGGVLGEAARVNLNRADQKLLAPLFESVAGLGGQAADNLAAAVIRWREGGGDGLTGRGGGGYYVEQDKTEARAARNFRSVYELLLLPGMDQATLAKVLPYVTVCGDGKINLNGAGRVVLRSLGMAVGGNAEVADSLASKLVAFQGENFFAKPSSVDIIQQLKDYVTLKPAEESLLSLGMMTHLTLRSRCFSGTAEGRVSGDVQGVARVDFVFDRDREVKLYWHEH